MEDHTTAPKITPALLLGYLLQGMLLAIIVALALFGLMTLSSDVGINFRYTRF